MCRTSLEPYLTAPLEPTLCFSDTHLVPEDLPWASDAPEDLLALVESFPGHRLVVLGDLTESIGVDAGTRRLFETSERLAPLFRAMAARNARIVVGNHDVCAVDFLERRFGRAQVSNGGFELGRLRVRHGHEASPFRTWLESKVGPVAVPVYERFRRRSRPERLDNDAILARVGARAPFVLFGHTHAPRLDARAANPGCFLRSAQSFLTLRGFEVILYGRDADRAASRVGNPNPPPLR